MLIALNPFHLDDHEAPRQLMFSSNAPSFLHATYTSTIGNFQRWNDQSLQVTSDKCLQGNVMLQ